MTIRSGFSKAVRKTMARGYQPLDGAKVKTFSTFLQPRFSFVHFKVVFDDDPDKKEKNLQISILDVILDHEWATILWGVDADKHLSELVKRPTIEERLLYICENQD